MLILCRFLIFTLLLSLYSCNQLPGPNSDAMTVHALRLKPGEDLKQGIQQYVDEHEITAGWVMTTVGSLTDVHLRYANQEMGDTLRGHFEIVSLVGTVSTNVSHLHLSVSDSTGRTTGGHLLEGNLIYTTAEIVVGESERHVFEREVDGTTPYKELQVKDIDGLK